MASCKQFTVSRVIQQNSVKTKPPYRILDIDRHEFRYVLLRTTPYFWKCIDMANEGVVRDHAAASNEKCTVVEATLGYMTV